MMNVMKKRMTPQFSSEPQAVSFNDDLREYRLEGMAFGRETCTRDLAGKEFYECTFTDVTFTGRMRGCVFADAVFSHCDLSNTDLREAVFRRVVFDHCRLMGTDCTESRFEDTAFVSCQCMYAGFGGSHWQRTLLEDSSLREVSFSLCKFRDAEIRSCDFTGAEFANTKLAGLDLSDSTIAGILCEAEGLRGVIVNPEQAAAIAGLLGIIVKY